MERAREAGEAFLRDQTEEGSLPLRWEGAHLTNPQAGYGLDGDVNVYLFDMVKDGEVTGYAIVGNSKYGYPIFAAGTRMMEIPDAEQVRARSSTELGLDVDKETDVKGDGLLYLGIDKLYATYEVGDQSVAVNLFLAEKASLVSDLASWLPSPKEYQERKKATAKSKPDTLRGSGYKVLGKGSDNKPDTDKDTFTYFNDSYPYCACCGPCSGASIGGYYRDRLDGQDYDMWCSDFSTFYQLCQEMVLGGGCPYSWENCEDCVTLPSAYGPGFMDMIDYCCQGGSCSNFEYDKDKDWIVWVGHNDYWYVTESINNQWPVALACYGLPRGVFEGHWTAIVGVAKRERPDGPGWTRIYAQRVDANGNVLWGKGGTSVTCLGESTMYAPASEVTLAADRTGGVILGWWQGGETESLRAQRIDASGKPVWKEGGVTVDTGHIQPGFSVVADGHGGATIVYWWTTVEESGKHGIFEIRAMRIGPGGEYAWPQKSIRVAPKIDNGSYGSPEVAGNAKGGVIAGFTVGGAEYGRNLLYVQRINAEGERLWGKKGAQLSP